MRNALNIGLDPSVLFMVIVCLLFGVFVYKVWWPSIDSARAKGVTQGLYSEGMWSLLAMCLVSSVFLTLSIGLALGLRLYESEVSTIPRLSDCSTTHKILGESSEEKTGDASLEELHKETGRIEEEHRQRIRSILLSFEKLVEGIARRQLETDGGVGGPREY